MSEPSTPRLRPEGLPCDRNEDPYDLSHLRRIRTRQREVALQMTAVLMDPELRVRLPRVRSVFAVRA